MNYVNKGHNNYTSQANTYNLKSKLSQVEFLAPPQHIPNFRTLITRLDSNCQLAFTVLNSPHMVYCSVVFSNFDSSLAVQIKLMDFVEPDDCPCFDNRGKTNLCIDDAHWTSNDAFVIILFSSLTFAVLPRLGSNLIATYNPTIINIS